jgi:hypothetical protein
MELAAPLQRFVDYLPDKPRYADASKILGRIAGKDLALRRGQYVEHASNKLHYLAFDVDTPEAGAAWLDAGAPPPTIGIVNRTNGHAHLLFELEQPVLLPIQGHWADWLKPGPIAYARDIRIAGTVCLGADAGYTGASTKNPLHPAWSTYTNDVRYTLGDMADGFRLDELVPARGNTDALLAYVGRNDELFHEVRKWSYREVKDFLRRDYSAFYEAILAHCQAYNMRFDPPLGQREVSSTARSIARWTWSQRYRAWIKEHWKSRGAMYPFGREPIDKTLPWDEQIRLTRERQSNGARFTNHNQRRHTEAKIWAAVRRLHREGKRITKAAVAREAGVHRDTVYRYQHLLD